MRILLVDDDVREYEILKYQLQIAYETHVILDLADSAEAGLDAALNRDYDAHLIDQNLNGRDGLWVIRQARKFGNTKPLILFTSIDDRVLEAMALAAGASDYFVKGRYDGPMIRRMINYAIQRSKASAELVEARRAAEAADRAKGRFLAMVSHELRTPLTPVLIAVTDLAERLEDLELADLRNALRMIKRNIELEARIIDDLLDLSRCETGSMRLELVAVDVHQTIRNALEICKDLIERSGLRVRLQLHATHSIVKADAARLLQIAWNLISNATKFAEGGMLTIRSSCSADGGDDQSACRIVVDFIDNGKGIDPGAASAIFAPFVQLAPELRTRGNGLGLGLTISRTLARAQGGDLTLEPSQRGRGATFRLGLVSWSGGMNRDGDPSRQTDPAFSDPVNGDSRDVPDFDARQIRLLLVEDNKDTLRYLTVALGRHYNVEAAACLADAREAARDRHFDVLLSDVELPDGTGLDLMRELSESRNMVGISMSGYGSQTDIEESKAAGFSMHLTKPIESARIVKAVVDALKSAGTVA